MTEITILKPKEMADELNVSYQTFMNYLKEDKDFPVVRLHESTNTIRFVKEKVFEYLLVKKNLDCIPSQKQANLILS